MEANVILVGATVFKADVSMKIERWVRFPHVSAKIWVSLQYSLGYYGLDWFFLSCFFFDRENKIMIILQLSSLFILTIITILRTIESRNEWRKIIDDGDVEIKDKISFWWEF